MFSGLSTMSVLFTGCVTNSYRGAPFAATPAKVASSFVLFSVELPRSGKRRAGGVAGSA